MNLSLDALSHHDERIIMPVVEICPLQPRRSRTGVSRVLATEGIELHLIMAIIFDRLIPPHDARGHN